MTATTSNRLGAQQPLSAFPNWRVWLLGLAGFALVAGVVLVLPIGALGWRILLLVLLFHFGLVMLAHRTGDEYLWRAWTVLAPLSVVMVLPDWFLSAVLGSLEFPDTGGPFIGTVPLFMAGMWTIALIPIVLVGALVEQRTGTAAESGGAATGDSRGMAVAAVDRGLLMGATAAAIAGLIFFWVAELVAPSIPIWQPVDVPLFAGVAAYVLLPEAILSAAAYVLVATAGRVPRAATAALVALLPFTYTGMLATSYQFLG